MQKHNIAKYCAELKIEKYKWQYIKYLIQRALDEIQLTESQE